MSVRGAAGGDGFQIAGDGRIARLRGEQTSDALLGFPGALRRTGFEPVQAASGMGVQREGRRRLGGQGVACRVQDVLFENVVVVDGVVCV